MPKKTFSPLPKKVLSKLTSLDWAILSEFEKEDSPIKDYVTAVVLRVVLENASLAERRHFLRSLEKDEEKASVWVKKRAEKHQREIFQQLEKFLKKVKTKYDSRTN